MSITCKLFQRQHGICELSGGRLYAQDRALRVISAAGPYSFTHNSNGNTRVIVEKNPQGVESGRRTITYDYDHRVISVNVSGTATRCAYDFSGMRVKKQTGASRTLYFGELYERSADGSNTKHIFAGSRRIASKKSANEIYYYHADHLGSTRVLTDKNGQEVQTFFYEPFGKTKSVTGSSPINYKYTGQEEDPETGFYYYKSRYYDPVIGRFISQDPPFQAAFDPPTFNRLYAFAYMPNDPPICTVPFRGQYGNDRSVRRSLEDPPTGDNTNRFSFTQSSSSENHTLPLGRSPGLCRTERIGNISRVAWKPGDNLNYYAYVRNNPINRLDVSGLADIYAFIEGDLVKYFGIEGAYGFAIDTNNWRNSGFFKSLGGAIGANTGISAGGGIAFRDVDGAAANFDVNGLFGSATLSFDQEGFNGFALGVGPGAGASVSLTYTWMSYTVDDFIKDAKDFWVGITIGF